jgi:hypothetical protein
MELDDFKKRKGQNTFVVPDNKNGYKERVDEMIHLFKSYQEKQRRISLGWTIINSSLAVIYLSFLHRYTGHTAIGFILMGVGVLGGALFLYFRYKPISPLSYSLPMTEFLTKAEKQIRYFTMVDYLIVFLLLTLLGTGGGFVFTFRLLRYTDKIELLIIIWVIFFLALVVFGFLAGRKNWKKEYGALHKNLQEMKSFYTNGDTNNK